MRRRATFSVLPLLLGPLTWAGTPPTYENFAERFFTTYCTSCHHSTRPPEERHGAPEGIDFDNLELIREQWDAIAGAALGEEPFMPPANGVWDWDRVLLAEWIAAELPGDGDEHLPAKDLPPPLVVSRWYERMRMDVTRPNGMPANQRKVHIVGLQHFTGKQNVLEEDIELRREADGSVVVLSQRRRRDGVPANPFLKYIYSPPVPVVFPNMQPGQSWEQAVQATPRFDDGSTGPTASISFRVTAEGSETLDNGIGAPVEAFRVRLKSHNPNDRRNPDSEEIWWFSIGTGPVRFARVVSPLLYTDVPDAVEGMDKAYLAAAPEIRNDTQSYFPFENGTRVYGFEHQRKIYLDGPPPGEPTETPTLGPDHTRTRTPSPTITQSFTVTPTPSRTGTDTATPLFTETATETPSPSASPSETTSPSGPPSASPTETSSVSATETPSPTPTETAFPTITETPEVSGTATETPDATETPEWKPGYADQDGNSLVNSMDLLMFLGHWGMEPTPDLSGDPPPGDPRRSDINSDGEVSLLDLLGFALEWER